MIPGPAFGPAAARRPLLAGVHPAVRVAGALLAVATAFVVPAAAVPAAAAVAIALLAAAGLGVRAQVRAAAAWWPVALLVLGVHAVTATAAAPLGHPSWAGLAAGAAALLRVAAAAGALAVLTRTTALDELTAGVGWWTAPLRRGDDDGDLGLVLAVALGTAPSLLGEARRVEAVAALRRHGPRGPAARGPLARLRDRAAVVVPLLEALGRRAEALSLSLRRRRPAAAPAGRPPAVQLAVLLAWTGGLAWLAAVRAGGGW